MWRGAGGGRGQGGAARGSRATTASDTPPCCLPSLPLLPPCAGVGQYLKEQKPGVQVSEQSSG